MGSKQLRAFARRIVTDKIIMCFLCMVITAIIVIIVLSVVALVLTLFKGMVRSLLLAGGGAPKQTQVRALQAEEMVR